MQKDIDIPNELLKINNDISSLENNINQNLSLINETSNDFQENKAQFFAGISATLETNL